MKKEIRRNQKGFFTVVAVAAALVVLLAGCSTTKDAVQPAAYVPGQEYSLVVLHTNDHHGTVLSKDGKAGLAERATYINSVREARQNVLVLDAGDINTGRALSNMFHAEPDIMAYNAMGYDAVTLGNHEFDGNLAKLEKQFAQSDFTWLSANIFCKNGKPLATPYIVRDFDGFRVGIFGLTTLRTLVTASPDKSLSFEDEITAAQRLVSLLKEQELADVVILLGHLGSVEEAEGQNTSQKIAQAVSGIDLIIDGHSHTKFEEPLYVNGTPIVSANEWGKFMGEAVLTIQDGKVTGLDWKPVEISASAFPPDALISEKIKPYKEAADASLKEVVMVSSDVFEFGNRLSRYKEIALGNLVCDATEAYLDSTGVHVDFAFHNGGNIRAELPAGDVTKEHIMTVLPFENYVYVLTLKGEDVIELFDFIGTIKQGAGAFAQVSKSVSYTITYDADGNGKTSDVLINGQPIVPTASYRIATNDYLAGGGDGYTVLTKSIDTYNTSKLLSDLVIDYVKTLPQPVEPLTDGRITVVGGVNP